MGSHTKHVLTVKAITASKATRLRDGGGLWLVQRGGGRYWLLYYRIAGKRRELGLGPLHTVGLAEARQKAEAARSLVRQGIDPIAHRRGTEAIQKAEAKAAALTFGTYADSFVDAAVKAKRWKGAKTEANWRNSITNHAGPIRERALSEIGVTDVLLVLNPLWGEKQESAEKLRERIERILDAAKVEGLRAGENPAQWRGHLEHLLHKPNALIASNHAAMPWRAVPAFMKGLATMDTIGALALQFTILSACRSGEVRGALWSEIDLPNKLWVIPPIRMKAGREHRVPLSDRAVDILKAMQVRRINDFVFPGARADKPMSYNTLSKVLSDNGGGDYTVHGFRSAFRDWVTEATTHDGDLAEMSLAHAVGDAVTRAYARSDAIEKRRAIMADWAAFVAGPVDGVRGARE